MTSIAQAYKHFSPSIRKIALRCMAKRRAPIHLLDDCTQSAWVRICKEFSSYDPLKSSFGAWVHALARFAIIDFLVAYARRKSRFIDKQHLEMTKDADLQDFLLFNRILTYWAQESKVSVTCALYIYLLDYTPTEAGALVGLADHAVCHRLKTLKQRTLRKVI